MESKAFMKNVAEFSNIVSDIAMINELAKSNPTAFVQRCEQDYMIQLKKTCDLVMEDLARYSLLLLAGPSSSGKTTTAYKLSGLFKERGIEASVISLDDFFLGKSQYPLLSDGKPDMESVNALDVELINRCFSDLVSKGEALFPQFDFATSSAQATWHKGYAGAPRPTDCRGPACSQSSSRKRASDRVYFQDLCEYPNQVYGGG